MDRENHMDRTNQFLGIVLIMAGVLIGLTALDLIPGFSMLFILAGGFLTAYFVFHRNIGFLIPGCILAAVASFITLKEAMDINGVYILLFLGSAFMGIFLIHTLYLKTDHWGEKYWPLFPGTILIVIGTLVLSAQQELLNRKVFSLIAPVLLIGVGLIILFGGTKKSN